MLEQKCPKKVMQAERIAIMLQLLFWVVIAAYIVLSHVQAENVQNTQTMQFFAKKL